MAEATVRFDLGAESVTVALPVELPSGGVPLSGDVSGTFGDCFVAGDVNLTGNLFIEGLMTGIDTFRLKGNGFTVFFQNGGRADLQGKFKGVAGEWGTGERAADTTGWLLGDRLAIAPTAVGAFASSERTWLETWTDTSRPPNSPDVTMVDGSVRRPEVVNLNQSIVIENLSRGFHFHDSAGIQHLSDIKFLNCGTPNVLGNYPIHFHMNGDNTRGSIIERVIVEGGKNHAFVPHASHGISFLGCVAYNTTGPAFWWDPPPETDDTINDSNDIAWDKCGVLGLAPGTDVGNSRAAGFSLGAGQNLRCNDSWATGVQGNVNASSEGNRQRSGFHWPEGGSRTSWEFQRCVGHNNVDSGLLVWQNARAIVNLLEDFVAYNNGFDGINHGSYTNRYHYAGAVLTGNGFRQHAKSAPEGPLVIEDILSDSRLYVTSHNSAFAFPSFYRRCSFPSVMYRELALNNPSHNVFEDCGLVPTDFDLAGIRAGSIIEIKEGGTLVHKWQSGAWS